MIGSVPAVNINGFVIKGLFDRCGVEVTRTKVRRERMGHTSLKHRFLTFGIS